MICGDYVVIVKVVVRLSSDKLLFLEAVKLSRRLVLVWFRMEETNGCLTVS